MERGGRRLRALCVGDELARSRPRRVRRPDQIADLGREEGGVDARRRGVAEIVAQRGKCRAELGRLLPERVGLRCDRLQPRGEGGCGARVDRAQPGELTGEPATVGSNLDERRLSCRELALRTRQVEARGPEGLLAFELRAPGAVALGGGVPPDADEEECGEDASEQERREQKHNLRPERRRGDGAGEAVPDAVAQARPDGRDFGDVPLLPVRRARPVSSPPRGRFQGTVTLGTLTVIAGSVVVTVTVVGSRTVTVKGGEV